MSGQVVHLYFFFAWGALIHIRSTRVMLYILSVGSFLNSRWILCLILKEKRRDLTLSYDKRPYTHRKIQKATWQHKNATKNFDYTMIADRLRTVSWSNNSYPTSVVKPVYERSTLKVFVSRWSLSFQNL